MDKKERWLVGTYILLSLVAIVVLTVLVSKKCKSQEPYRKCFCSQGYGGRQKVCQDTVKAWKDYENGKTEYAKMPDKREWTKISPGDIDYPPSKGCPKCQGWQKWDYTDFGS